YCIIYKLNHFSLVMIIISAVLIMLTGALGTINNRSIWRMLSYLIVCHIGYLIAGLSLFTELAFVAVIFYLIHDAIVKSNVFTITGVIFKIRETVDMSRLGGLLKDYPKFSLVVAVVLFSLVGIPPLSG